MRTNRRVRAWHPYAAEKGAWMLARWDPQHRVFMPEWLNLGAEPPREGQGMLYKSSADFLASLETTDSREHGNTRQQGDNA